MFPQSKHLLVVLAFLLHNSVIFSQGDMDCPSPTFFKTFGTDFQAEYGTAIIKSSDDNLYIAGRDGNKTFIQKMSTSGIILWSKVFQVNGFEPVTPSQIIEDSDGMIVGCGTQGFPGLSKAFVFKFNPINQNIQWAHQISSNNPNVAGIVENGPGGNYFLYQSSQLGSGEKDIEIIEINRANGQFNPGLAKRYQYVSSDAISKMIYVNGALYATGTAACRNGNFNLVHTRELLMRFDAGNLDPVWAHMNHLDTLIDVSFLGRDLVADSTSLISAYVGSNELMIGGVGNDTIYLQKTDFNGNLQWVRSYSVQAAVLKLLTVPDGFVIYGQQDSSQHIVFKTDKDGLPLWGRVLTENTPVGLSANNFAPSQAVAIGDSLYFTGTASNGALDIFMWKMTMDGAMADSCGFMDTLLVESTLVANPFRTIADLTNVFSTATSTAAIPATQPASYDLHQFCPDCNVPDPCPEGNDFTVAINDVYCENGEVNMQFTICELDGGEIPALTITFFNADPYTSPADAIGSYDYDPMTNDSCWSIELNDLEGMFGPAFVQSGAQIFAVVNVPENAGTPFNIDDFPLSAEAECNYLNNIDSVTVQIPDSPTLELGPDQTVCPNQGATLDAGAGFFKYQWSNGATTQTTTVNFSGQFRVTVTDFCGFRQTDTVQVQVLQSPQVQENGSFCPGKSVTIRGFTFDQPGIFQETLPGLNNDCDTIATFFIDQLPYENQTEIIQFCPGESVTINGITYTNSDLARDTIPGTIGCDTIVLYFLNQLPAPFKFDTAYICPGDSVLVGNIWYDTPGLVFDTIPATGPVGCDTVIRVDIFLLPQITILDTVEFCPGTSVTIQGQVYDQPGTASFILPNTGGGCDTLLEYTLLWLPSPMREDTIAFCQGSSVTIGGNTYTDPGTVQITVPGGLPGACDTLVTYTLEWIPGPQLTDTIRFCPGTSVEIDGISYTQPGVVLSTIMGNGGDCDTMITYTLEWLPAPMRDEIIQFCPGTSVDIDGVLYDQPGTVMSTITGVGGCDTLVTYTLEWLPYETASEMLFFCPGQTVVIGGNSYTQPGTVLDTIASTTGSCDTIKTYTLEFSPLPTRDETVEFCIGESVVLGGQTYTQPGTVTLTVPGASGACDTVVTYTLQYLDPGPSTLVATCPFNVNVITAPGTGPVVVDYQQPTATSDCVCPGIEWTLTAGLASGSLFPPGMTEVCYTATDSCGSIDECCFRVMVREEEPCETKTIGCIQYEIIEITSNADQEYTYHIRVTNNCSNKLIYTAIQLPDGVVATSPVSNSTFVSTDGREYLVRNPNFAPFYSIRFKSTTDSISNGESTEFECTLPNKSHPTFMRVITKLYPQTYYETTLNTFNCPIGVSVQSDNRNGQSEGITERIDADKAILLYPNPTSGNLFADLSDWSGERLNLRVLDSRGLIVLNDRVVADHDAKQISLPTGLPAGLYTLEIISENGERSVGRFILAW
ncbi:MAG: HYR domain-containing protein [Saprospiraceae bacterium]